MAKDYKALFGALLGLGSVLVACANEPLLNANWIWSDKAGFVAHFRRAFVIDGGTTNASISITADNGYELYVNGSFLGSDIGAESAVWQSVETFDLASVLQPGTNVVAIRATDLGRQAGVIVGVVIEQADGQRFSFGTDATWRTSASSDPTGFGETGYLEDQSWGPAKVIGPNGSAPWGIVRKDGPRSPNWSAGMQGSGFKTPLPDFVFPPAILCVCGRVPESSTAGSPQAVWRIGNSRAYLELDTLGPSMPGRSLALLEYDPARRDYTERIVYEASGGLVGSPSASHDGKVVWFSCVPPGEKFWRICKLTLDSGSVEKIGEEPFHDFDPEPLPDGRVVFSSTRIGNREEYHGNLARSLFVMNRDGTSIRPITHHIVGDMEPRVTADGNIAFVRQDNFMERAKVETHIHSVRPDGTAGQVLLGPDRGALGYSPAHAAEENGLWLRNYGFGSPAPLPDGRVAALSYKGLVISGNSVQPEVTLRPAMELVDIAPLPDGRVLCTLAGQSGIGVLDLAKNEITRIYTKPRFDLHSAVIAGARAMPPMARSAVEEQSNPSATGFLLGQSVFLTRQQNVDMSRVKAIRVIEGRPFALRSARHPYAHLGVEAVELGTVPVASDGSFYIEVPADRALSMQAVDGQGRSVVNELSWIYVRPGEQRSCVGCHSQREAAPLNSSGILALRSPPVKLLGKGQPHRWRGNNAANGGVLNLQFDRMREIGSINLASGQKDSLEHLLSELKASNSDARLSAIQHLALRREKAAAAALESLLSDDSPDARMNAALALASCGTANSLQPLLKAMFEDEPIIAQAAHRTVQTLTACTNDFNAFAPATERAASRPEWLSLQNTSGIATVESNLREAVRRKEATEDTLNALAQIGSEASAPAVRDFLRSDSRNDLRLTLAGIRALGQIGSADSVSQLAALLRICAKPSAAPAEGDHEFGWTQSPVQIAAAAAEALGRIRTRHSEQELVAAFGQLTNFWHYSFNTADHDWLMGCHASPVHFRIVQGLDRPGVTNTVPIIGQLLESIPIDTDRGLLFENDAYEVFTANVIARSGVRDEIVRACADVLQGRVSASRYLRSVTHSPPAVSVGPLCAESRAAQIISILATRENANLIRCAFDRFQTRQPSRARSWTCFYLARAMGKIRDDRAIPLLTSTLLKERPEAAFGISSPPNVFVYEAMTPFHRAAVADALGRIGESSCAPVLIKTVRNMANALDVRHAAANALLRLDGIALPDDFASLASNYPDISVRRLLLQVLTEGTPRGSNPEKLARIE